MTTAAVVRAPRVPLREMGWLAGVPASETRTRMYAPAPATWAPEIPFYQLGYLGQSAGRIVSAAAAPAGAATTAATAAAAGSWAGPIGAGVAVVVGLIGGLLAAHALRKKQAKDENSAMNLGVQGFDDGLRQIQSDFNAGRIDANGAMQAVQVLLSNYWDLVSPYIQPGRNGCQSGAACPSMVPANYCSGDIGAACCVGCADLVPSIAGPNGVMAAIAGMSGSSSGPHTAEILKVFGSKYGGRERGAYTLDFKAPEGALSSLTESVQGSVAGGSSSILPLLLMGGAALLLLR
jgi:hypothetical protein